jgi:hypothetical protein
MTDFISHHVGTAALGCPGERQLASAGGSKIPDLGMDSNDSDSTTEP